MTPKSSLIPTRRRLNCCGQIYFTLLKTGNEDWEKGFVCPQFWRVLRYDPEGSAAKDQEMSAGLSRKTDYGVELGPTFSELKRGIGVMDHDDVQDPTLKQKKTAS